MSISGSIVTRKNFKIILLGDSGVGKTSIIERYIHNEFDSHENPTIGIDFLGKTVKHKGINCRLQLWDSAGQQKYMSLIPSYLRDSDCVLFCFDLSKPSTLENIDKWIHLYRQNHHRKTISLICGNKSDLTINLDKDKLKQIMEKYRMPYHAVSAKSGQNINELFHLIVDMILINTKRQENFNSRRIQDIIIDELETAGTEGRMSTKYVKKEAKNMTLNVSEEKQFAKKFCFC